MILNLFRRTPRTDTIAVLYGAIVAQARRTVFYQSCGVPDTANGRLEMIVLHAVAVLARLEAEEGPNRRLGQALFDHFCADMDANLREMGIGDLGVPKKMKAIGEAFYGRKRAYEMGLAAAGDADLAAALARNVYGVADAPGAQSLAAYLRATVRMLAATDDAALLRGEIDFPDPAAFVQPEPVGAP